MPNDVNCKYYDPINGWCEKLSDFGYPKHFEYCPKSPCEYAEPIEQSMTDNDIIKALAMCIDDDAPCYDCPWYESESCLVEIKEAALGLINRQKAEIERLKLTHALKIGEVQEHYRNQIGKARAEAIKEFAERLKRDITINNTEDGCLIYSIDYGCLMEDIDSLVDEMTEDNDA